MPTMQPVSNVQFRVETTIVHNGRKLGRLRPDGQGYYNNVPVAVLGIPTSNRTYYDVGAFTDQITSPDATINKRLSRGQLYGEWGHPAMIGLVTSDQMARLADIRESQHSHHIQSLSTGATLENGGKVINASIKPTGPYGASLKENFDDPCMNTAFSLRAITMAADRGGLSYRTMKKLITFDAVGCGGYEEASKAYSAGLESFDHFDIEILPTGTAVFTEASLECFTDTELNEWFGASKITHQKQVVTLARTTDRFNGISSRQMRSLFHDHFRG